MTATTGVPPCSILLLAGGRGQRVAGQDKGLLDWCGAPLVAHLHAQVRTLTDDLIVSCNRNQVAYAQYADRVVGDPCGDFPGPLAGILAGLEVARHSLLLVLPCDVPRVDAQLLHHMRQAQSRHPSQPLMIRQGEHWEPLLCIIPLASSTAFQHAWETGERSPRKIMLALGATALECVDNDPRLANFNTPQMFAAHPPPG